MSDQANGVHAPQLQRPVPESISRSPSPQAKAIPARLPLSGDYEDHGESPPTSAVTESPTKSSFTQVSDNLEVPRAEQMRYDIQQRQKHEVSLSHSTSF